MRWQAVRDLRSARRRRYVASFDWVDTLFRAYVTAILAGLAVALISGSLGDQPASSQALAWLRSHGSATLGLGVAAAVALGLRAGARGGPLAVEAPDVHHLLLAPVPRGRALRRVAVRQLRTPVVFTAVVGAIAANLAFRRLPGPPAEWLVCGAVFAACAAMVVFGAALLASGLRLALWQAIWSPSL